MRTISAQVDDHVFASIGRLAKLSHKSNEDILIESLNARLEYEKWVDGAIRQGMEDIKDGRTIPHNQAVNMIDKIFDAD